MRIGVHFVVNFALTKHTMHMISRTLIFISLLFSCMALQAQPGSGKGGGMRGGGMTGRFYGKIIDAKTKKGIEFATVSLFQNRFDSVTKTMSRKLVTGQLTESNGDFSLENIPVRGQFTIRVSSIGYDSLVQPVSFGKPDPANPGAMSLDKDLGNLQLKPRAQELGEVVVDGTPPAVELKPDRRVYNMDKNDLATGGTAEDALKTIPSVSVDMDGNVSLRNSSPQIFIDGRPTTFTLDQIPADAIQSIEVITSPSAKYDASGGGAGIINIVLKKNRKAGYNGSVRAGVDMRGKVNGGVDFNVKQGKINVFVSGNVMQRRSLSSGETDRLNYYESPQTSVLQSSKSENSNMFIMGRAGVDYFIDNRNTITFAGNYNTGQFKSGDDQSAQTDTLYPSIASSRYDRSSDATREFHNYGASVLYKRLFTKDGKELTADLNYNYAGSDNTTITSTNYFDQGQFDNPDRTALQRQTGGGNTAFFTGQTDFATPLNDKMKLESGGRVAIRNFVSSANVAIFDEATDTYVTVVNPFSDYTYTDNVYAAYSTFSHSVSTKFSYQAGLRVESSDYRGKLNSTSQTFRNLYPVSLFPSGSLSYKPNDKHDFQLLVSRRINRPGFFQMMPYTDYSDSLNLSRGNPELKPEFTYKGELTYMRIFSRESNILASVYYRNTQGIITRYQATEYDSTLGREALISTYENASSSYMYGADLSATVVIKKWLQLDPSGSAYYTGIDGSNIASNLTNKQFSWNSRLTVTMRLPKNITIQLMGDYSSRTANSGGGGGRGMGGMGGGMGYGGSSSSVQGYNIENYGMDASIKYAFLKEKAASLTLSVSDVFKTRKSGSHSESEFFLQDTWRIRDQQFFRLNFSYRFGKFDAVLFKRKNTHTEGVDMGM